MRHQTGWAALSVSHVCLIVSILIFARGFFPYKSVLPGLAKFEENELAENAANAPFDKLIFMVVDALRSDFVFSDESAFEFTQSLIRDGAAMPFTAHAAAPTITMPRIKAITTGSIPSFLDVILNFAESDTTSTLANQDSWLAQLKRKGENGLTMFGDDTWLKLFPDFFKRSDGTTSFFVSDFTEVDMNVTRHVPGELAKDDWDTMVLHYLGLDHIGHKAGPRSPNMKPKQAEMDLIVRTIYESMETKSHLSSAVLVICGDHGMNDAGNHGGSAPGETSPALVFVSPKLKSLSGGLPSPIAATDAEFDYYRRVDQSDIAPTLAGLFGFPVPLNNLGVIIPEFLNLWTDWEQSLLLARNSMQILNIVNKTFPGTLSETSSSKAKSCSSDVEALSCGYDDHRPIVQRIQNSGTVASVEERDSLLKFCQQMQSIMSSTASNYDLSKLKLGILIASTSAVLIAISVVLFPIGLDLGLSAISLIALSYGLMMFASSYVEEEQYFWYWCGALWITLLSLKSNSKSSAPNARISWILMISSHRIIQRWNQTGQKHAGESDIFKSFLSKHADLLGLAVISSYALTFLNFVRLHKKAIGLQLYSAGACGLALIFKINFSHLDAPELGTPLLEPLLEFSDIFSLVNQARIAHVTALAAAAFSYLLHSMKGRETKLRSNYLAESLHISISLWLLTQTRYGNIPIFLFFHVQLYALGKLDLSISELTATSLLFQYLSFFAFGGSNAISSVDLANAYNGVSGYNVLAVGILTFVSNWAGPIWWVSATVTLLSKKRKRGDVDVSWIKYVTLISVFTIVSLLSVMVACMALRTHLFIWTVFSPKYLYVMAWTIAHHLGVNVLLGGFLWFLVT